jgi:hypothetical protein
VASDTFYAHNYALATDWAVEDEVNADAIWNWAESHGTFLMDRLMIDYEWRIAQFAVNTSNVSTVTLVSCGWHNAGAAIFTQLGAYKERFRRTTGMVPNTLVIPQTVKGYFASNSQLSALLFGNNGGVPTEQQLAGLIGIDRVIAPATQANTFGEVETINGSWSYTDIWGGDSVWLAHTNTLAGRETDTWINAFRWVNPALGAQFAVSRYPYDPKRKVYEMHVEYYQGEKVVSPDLAMRLIVNSGAPAAL